MALLLLLLLVKSVENCAHPDHHISVSHSFSESLPACRAFAPLRRTAAAPPTLRPPVLPARPRRPPTPPCSAAACAPPSPAPSRQPDAAPALLRPAHRHSGAGEQPAAVQVRHWLLREICVDERRELLADARPAFLSTDDVNSVDWGQPNDSAS
ncbi:hypothetical protein BDA96_05G204900 [Sorghum bicolor]|uniref:Uncharacterized protein n=1 Tax=Sorghum bicolor TaxID=4558 RepID=A0A921QYP2_SORBI|nr:hypothetical protein BDA96_05G204900 [Sorghum bicolor]